MSFTQPARLKKGDKVAIISPSTGLPHLFPWVYELGLKRMKEHLLLEPVEFPSARQSPEYLSKNPKMRAGDINAAFKDPSIKAVVATIGGNDQIRVLPFLDIAMIAKNPKIFMGYSDCTNLHLVLWNLGIISYYGGMLMTQFGMQGKMHDYTLNSIKKALFEPVIGQVEPSPVWTDFDLDWADPANLNKSRPLYKSEGWLWHNHENKTAKGRLWGGCLEILDLHLSVKHYLPSLSNFKDTVLFIETSEEMPSDGFVYRFIAALGELGILKQLKAILVGYPKTEFCNRKAPEGKEAYPLNQQTAIKNALLDYNSDLLVVFNVNIGHTDPQMIIPNGAIALIDGTNKTISFN